MESLITTASLLTAVLASCAVAWLLGWLSVRGLLHVFPGANQERQVARTGVPTAASSAVQEHHRLSLSPTEFSRQPN